MALSFTSQTMMTVRSGGSVTSCVKIVPGHITAAVLMGTSWSRVTSAEPTFQVHRGRYGFVCFYHKQEQ